MQSQMFFEQVWATLAGVPAGRVISYGQLALLAGRPDAPRLAGLAVRSAPDGLPCHRVVHTDGSLCPPALFDGRQRATLEEEGVHFRPSGKVDMRRSGLSGGPAQRRGPGEAPSPPY